MAVAPDPTHLPVQFKDALIVLGAAAIVVPLFQRLRVSPVLGFMLAGVIVGPYGIGALAGWFPPLELFSITSPESLGLVAELGVVMLMFMIGLEMSFARLWVMRRLVFGLGSLQMVLCAVVLTLALERFAGLPDHVAIVLGLALAMSSTAIVVQVLSDDRKLAAPLGRMGFAVLLLQDLAVVPVLFVLDSLQPGEDAAAWGDLAQGLGKAAVAVAVIFGVARLGLRPLFRGVARTGSPESFMAACLLVILSTALATAAAGLSMALGALLAGLLLAETEYRRQIEVTIEPFKGLLLGVFLLSIGMGLNLPAMAAAPFLLAVALVGLLGVKLAVITPLSWLFARAVDYPWRQGLRVALLLAPGGEFGFVILGLARASGLVPASVADPALIVLSISMALIPLLYRFGERFNPPAEPTTALMPPLLDETPRVLIAGFGRVGQTVAALLDRHGKPYLAMDRDPDRVSRFRRAGRPVYYGDITRPEMLRHLGIEQATALVVTLDDRRTADTLVSLARRERPDLLIVARAKDASHAAQLYDNGATDAVAETVESSLQLAEAVLVDLGVPMGPVIVSIHEQRAAHQAEVKSRVPHANIRHLGRARLSDVHGNRE